MKGSVKVCTMRYVHVYASAIERVDRVTNFWDAYQHR